MNQEKARSILRMFSGVADVKSLDPLLDEATAQVERMLLPDADRERPSWIISAPHWRTCGTVRCLPPRAN